MNRKQAPHAIRSFAPDDREPQQGNERDTLKESYPPKRTSVTSPANSLDQAIDKAARRLFWLLHTREFDLTAPDGLTRFLQVLDAIHGPRLRLTRNQLLSFLSSRDEIDLVIAREIFQKTRTLSEVAHEHGIELVVLADRHRELLIEMHQAFVAINDTIAMLGGARHVH